MTNYREQQPPRARRRSRGAIATDFLTGRAGASEFVHAFDGERYAGVNVIVADRDAVCYTSNRGDPPSSLAPGVYGLSNASLDTPWSKLTRTRGALAALLEKDEPTPARLFELLADRKPAPAAETGGSELPFGLPRALTAPFIVADDYGTRCSTVVMRGAAGDTLFHERRFAPDGSATGESAFEFRAGATL